MKQKHKAFSNKFSRFIFTSNIGPAIGYLFHLYVYVLLLVWLIYFNWWENPDGIRHILKASIKHKKLYHVHSGDLSGKEIQKGGDIYMYVWLIHFAVHSKLMQYCKATIIQ